MTIKEVLIHNFKSHEDTAIALSSGMNVFVGPSGAGKTSVLDAIALCLAGRNRLTDMRGAGMREMACNPNEASSIKVVVDNDLFERVFDKTSNSFSKNRVPSPNGLPADAAQIAALIDSKPIFDREPAELRAVFGALLAPSKFAEDFKKAGIPVPDSMTALERLIKETKEKSLRDARRDRKTLEAERSATEDQCAQIPSGRPAPIVSAELKEARGREKALEAARAKAQQMAELKVRLDAAREKYGNDFSVPLTDLESKLSESESEMAQLQAKIASMILPGLSRESSPYDTCPLRTCPMRKKPAPEKQKTAVAASQVSQMNEVRKLLETDIVGLRSDIAEIKFAIEIAVSLSTLPAPVYDAEFDRLQTEIAALDRELASAQQRDVATTLLSSLAARIEAKRLEAERIENALARMEEIRLAIASGVDSLAGEITKICGRFVGPVTFDPSEMTFKTGVDVKALSSGEQVILDAAIRAVVSKHTGFGVVVCDHMNHISDDQARLLRGMLLAMRQQFIGVWAASKKPPHVEGANVLWFSKDSGATVIEGI